MQNGAVTRLSLYGTPRWALSEDSPGPVLDSPVWPFNPNWANAIRETLEFRSEIIRSRNGGEQRRALRNNPRRSFELRVSATGSRKRRLDLLLNNWMNQRTVIAEPAVFVTTTLSLVGNIAQVDSLPEWVAPGLLVVLAASTRFEGRYIESIDNGSRTIKFYGMGISTWPPGTQIFRSSQCFLRDSIQSNRHTDSTAEIAAFFDEMPGTFQPVPASPSEVYDGFEVLVKRPNWSNIPQVDFTKPTRLVDFGYGRNTRFFPDPGHYQFRQFTFVNASSAETLELLDTFMRAKGQRGEFFVPTWESDLVPILGIEMLSSSLVVEGGDLALYHKNNPVLTDICVQLRNGRRVYARIAGMSAAQTPTGAATSVQLTTPWQESIALGDIKQISWMPLCRFSSDALTVEWLTDSVSRVQFNIQSLRRVTAEGL